MANEASGCLLFFLRWFQSVRDDGLNAGAMPYQRREYLFSKAEASFYRVLLQAVPAEAVVFAKVRMADVIAVKPKSGAFTKHFNRLSAKHFDFVICDRDRLRPLAAVELDDSSHDGEKRKERDSFVDAAAKAAGLPLLRIKARQAYDVRELAAALCGVITPPRE